MFHRHVEHAEFAITNTEEIHRFQSRIRILPRALQFRHRLAKSLRVNEVLPKFKSQLKIGRVALQSLFRFFDQYPGSLFFCRLKLFAFFRMHRVFLGVAGEKFLVRRDLALGSAHFRIGHLPNETGVAAAGQLDCALIPFDRRFDVVLLFAQRAQSSGNVDILRLGLLARLQLRDLLIECFARQLDSTLLFE